MAKSKAQIIDEVLEVVKDNGVPSLTKTNGQDLRTLLTDLTNAIVQIDDFNNFFAGENGGKKVVDKANVFGLLDSGYIAESLIPSSIARQSWVSDQLGTKADVTWVTSQLGTKADTSWVTTQLATKADLVGGVIPTSQIPAIAISEFLGAVNSQSAMLALSGQRGDWCIRTDVQLTYFLIADTPSNLSSWRSLETPASPVTSVNGQVGVVVLAKADVGLGNVDNTSDLNKPISTATQTALDLKDSILSFSNGLTRASNAITFGGTLTANTTLSGANTYSLIMGGNSGTGSKLTAFNVNTTALQFRNYTSVTVYTMQIEYASGAVTIGASDSSGITAGVSSQLVVDSTGAELRGRNAGTSQTSLKIGSTNAVFTDSRATKVGLVYAADYSANFTSRSLTDVGYVQAQLTSLTTTIYDNTKNAVGRLKYKGTCRVAVSTNVVLANPSGDSNVGTNTFDGITLNNYDRVLLFGQTNAVENGIYYYRLQGNHYLTKAIDWSLNEYVSKNVLVPIELGTYAGNFFKVTSAGIIYGTAGEETTLNKIGTDNINFSVFNNQLNLSGGTLTGFLTLNADPTSALHAVTKQYVDGLVVGLWNDRGSYDASSNTYPSTGGSGTGGAIKKGNLWTISVAGTLGGTAVQIGDTVRALVDSPGTTPSNWGVLENNFGYVAANVANLATSFSTVNHTLFPSVQAVKTYADALVADSITDGVTGIAPSQNAVYDALHGVLSPSQIDYKTQTVASASTITLSSGSGNVVLVTGTTTVNTISAGWIAGNTSLLTIVPKGVFDITNTGNIKTKSGQTITTVVNEPILFIYDSATLKWQQLTLITSEFKQTENGLIGSDFLDGNNLSVFAGSGSGTGAALTATARVAGRLGILTLSTGSTSTGRYRLGLASANNVDFFSFIGDFGFKTIADIRVPVLSNSTDRFYILANCYNDSVSSEGNNLIAFKYSDNVNSGKWQILVKKGGSQTQAIDSGVSVVAGTWYAFRTIVLATGLTLCYINNSLVATVASTDIPTTTAQPTGYFPVMIFKTVGTTSVDVGIDKAWIDLV